MESPAAETVPEILASIGAGGVEGRAVRRGAAVTGLIPARGQITDLTEQQLERRALMLLRELALIRRRLRALYACRRAAERRGKRESARGRRREARAAVDAELDRALARAALEALNSVIGTYD